MIYGKSFKGWFSLSLDIVQILGALLAWPTGNSNSAAKAIGEEINNNRKKWSEKLHDYINMLCSWLQTWERWAKKVGAL